MKRGRSTGSPTLAQRKRFVALQDIGCITCRSRGNFRHCEIHHLTIGGHHGQKRRGHDYTIGLCAWCHRGAGVPTGAPSYAKEPRAFREFFGDDETLLAEQNRLIDIWKQSFISGVAA